MEVFYSDLGWAVAIVIAVLWFSTNLPCICWDKILISLWPFPFIDFPVPHSSCYFMLCSVVADIVVK
jgi:hypothetical protein